MRIVIVRVGKESATDPFVQQAHNYLRRIRFVPIAVHTTPTVKGILHPQGKGIQKGQALKHGACQGCHLIALDERGHEPTSTTLTAQLQTWLANDQSIAFVIGPACGLGQEMLQQAHAVWSLSQLTLPHRMAFCLLAEQLYRTGEILKGSAYHK